MTPSFCSLTDTKQSLQYTIKTHLSGPPMPKFEANMNYIPPSPPSSMKQCNKSATVKFHMELLLTTTTRKLLRPGSNLAVVRHLLFAMGHFFKSRYFLLWVIFSPVCPRASIPYDSFKFRTKCILSINDYIKSYLVSNINGQSQN